MFFKTQQSFNLLSFGIKPRFIRFVNRAKLYFLWLKVRLILSQVLLNKETWALLHSKLVYEYEVAYNEVTRYLPHGKITYVALFRHRLAKFIKQKLVYLLYLKRNSLFFFF